MKDSTEDGFQEAFKSLKRDKASGPDGLYVNILPSVYNLIKKPLLKILNDSLTLIIFPENTKIAR